MDVGESEFTDEKEETWAILHAKSRTLLSADILGYSVDFGIYSQF